MSRVNWKWNEAYCLYDNFCLLLYQEVSNVMLVRKMLKNGLYEVNKQIASIMKEYLT